MQHHLTTVRLAAASAMLALMQISFSPAHASEQALAPSPALACLTRAADAPALPVYPPERYARKEGGEFIVELEFRAAGRAPKVRLDKVNKLYSDEAFVDAIETFAEHYRVPCLVAGEPPVTLRQRYEFIPNDGRKVVPSAPTDHADLARRAQLKCLVHVGGAARPQYPQRALQNNQEERLVARLRYAAPDQPPELTWLAQPRHTVLRWEVEHYVSQLRMPCLNNGPIALEQMFVFVIDGNARTVLRDMTLVQLLGGSKDYALPAYFDFNTMGCPFDVRMTYMRPYLPNVVHELESGNPARKPLLEWMSGMTLTLADSLIRKVLGDAMTVTIPCGQLDL